MSCCVLFLFHHLFIIIDFTVFNRPRPTAWYPHFHLWRQFTISVDVLAHIFSKKVIIADIVSVRDITLGSNCCLSAARTPSQRCDRGSQPWLVTCVILMFISFFSRGNNGNDTTTMTRKNNVNGQIFEAYNFLFAYNFCFFLLHSSVFRLMVSWFQRGMVDACLCVNKVTKFPVTVICILGNYEGSK